MPTAVMYADASAKQRQHGHHLWQLLIVFRQHRRRVAEHLVHQLLLPTRVEVQLRDLHTPKQDRYQRPTCSTLGKVYSKISSLVFMQGYLCFG